MSTKHSKAAKKFLENSEWAAWHNDTLWMVREKRDKMSRSVPEWEDLRQASKEIKLYSNSHLADLLQEFEKNATANGAIVHWAKDAEEYCQIIHQILSSHNARSLIKSKSMLSEECHLNKYLESQGINVTESDLGEHILQLMHQPPSHIVLPAIHVRKEEIGELFRSQNISDEPGNNDQTYLTHAARHSWRHQFLEADAAMTGANFAVASTGECVVCTNEGNAEMGTSQSKLQITAFGIEKIVPNRRALGVFTRLLARSATGQPVTTYMAHYAKPRKGGEFHIIIVDNGRSSILADDNHYEMLNCLRCGACMNTCPVYRRSGGYSYTYFIPGPLGINMGMLKDPARHKENLSACSLCYSCQNVCPAKINLADQIYSWRQQISAMGMASSSKKVMSEAMKFVMENPALFNFATGWAHVANNTPSWVVNNSLNEWGQEREMPKFAKESFNELWKKHKVD